MIKRLYMEDSGDFEQRGDRKRGYRRAPKGLTANKPFNRNTAYNTMVKGARGFTALNKEGLKKLLDLVDSTMETFHDNWDMNATGDDAYVTDDFTVAFDIWVNDVLEGDVYEAARFLRKAIRTKFRAPSFGLEVEVADPYFDDVDGYFTLVVRSTDAYFETEYEDDDYSDIRPKKPDYANENYRRRFRRR